MQPILFRVGPLPVYSYGFFYGLGIVVAMAVVERRARLRGLDTHKVLDLCLVALVSIIVGARLFFVIQFASDFRGNTLDALKIWKGGQVLYGGLLLTVVTSMWYARHHKLDIRALGDSFAPAIPLGVGIGRIGCFMNGCCYGKVADGLPWAVEFPKLFSASKGIIGSPAFVDHMHHGLVESSSTSSLPVHPTQLYSVVVAWATAGLLFYLGRSTWCRGKLIWVYLGMYAATRFAIEFFRGDNESVVLGLTISQVVGLLVLMGLALGYWRLRRRDRLGGGPTTTPAG